MTDLAVSNLSVSSDLEDEECTRGRKEKSSERAREFRTRRTLRRTGNHDGSGRSCEGSGGKKNIDGILAGRRQREKDTKATQEAAVGKTS